MTSRSPLALTPSSIAVVKRMLSEGRSQAHIAAVVGVSQASVSRIKAGELGAEVNWPDGRAGSIPLGKVEKKIEKWSAKAAAYLSFTEDMQQHILAVVNESRREAGLGEIPEADSTYITYLQQEAEMDIDEQVATLDAAVQSEDRRIVRVMEEFQHLSEAEALRAKDSELQSLLEETSERGMRTSIPAPVPLETELKYDALSLEELLEIAGKVPFVLEAVASPPEEFLELAARVLFYQLRNSDPRSFREPFVEKEIRRLAAKLRERAADLQEQ